MVAGRRRPRPPCGPTPRGTLHSETILRKKLMSLNLEKNIVIYTIMTIKGTARRAWHLVIWSKMVRLDPTMMVSTPPK
jgi:hypothetical protein